MDKKGFFDNHKEDKKCLFCGESFSGDLDICQKKKKKEYKEGDPFSYDTLVYEAHRHRNPMDMIPIMNEKMDYLEAEIEYLEGEIKTINSKLDKILEMSN